MSDKVMRRPKSEDLADLHVFVVPIESWLGKYSVAYNSVALQSTSAGFIRVYQHATLTNIRNIIAEQLESNVLPNEYVFLRSVGRCMAVVNKSQENNMKAKHFLPPVAYSPEIFILPGTHDWIASLRDQTRSIVVSKDHLVQDENRHHQSSGYGQGNFDNISYYEKFSQQNSSSGISEDLDDYSQDKERNEEASYNMEPVGKQNAANSKIEQTEKQREEVEPIEKRNYTSPKMAQARQKSRNSSDSSEMLSEENLSKISKQQNRSKSNNSSPESNRYVSSSMDARPRASSNVENYRNRSLENDKKAQLKSPIAAPTIQVIHPEMLSQPVQHGRLPTPTPLPSANVIHSTLKYNNQEQTNQKMIESPRDSKESSRPLSRENQDDKKKDEENKFDVEEKNNNNDSLISSESTSDRDDDKDGFTQDESSTDDITSDDNVKINGEELSTNNRYELKSKDRARSLKEEMRRNAEKRLLDEEKMRLEDKKRSMENETLQLMQGMEELLQKKKEEELKRKKEEEERKRKEKAQLEQKKQELEALREEFQKYHKMRAEKQKERDGLVRKTKDLKARIEMKKSEENNIWKKKYEEAKERTNYLEEKLLAVKEELSMHQKKLLEDLEGKGSDSVDEQKSPSKTVSGPSVLNNLRNEARRYHNDIQVSKSDVEKSRKILEKESRKKAEAQKVLKEMRSQVNEKRKVATVKKATGTPRDIK